MQFLLEQSVQTDARYFTFFPIPITPLIDFTGCINDESVSETPQIFSWKKEKSLC